MVFVWIGSDIPRSDRIIHVAPTMDSQVLALVGASRDHDMRSIGIWIFPLAPEPQSWASFWILRRLP